MAFIILWKGPSIDYLLSIMSSLGLAWHPKLLCCHWNEQVACHADQSKTLKLFSCILNFNKYLQKRCVIQNFYKDTSQLCLNLNSQLTVCRSWPTHAPADYAMHAYNILYIGFSQFSVNSLYITTETSAWSICTILTCGVS